MDKTIAIHCWMDCSVVLLLNNLGHGCNVQAQNKHSTSTVPREYFLLYAPYKHRRMTMSKKSYFVELILMLQASMHSFILKKNAHFKKCDRLKALLAHIFFYNCSCSSTHAAEDRRPSKTSILTAPFWTHFVIQVLIIVMWFHATIMLNIERNILVVSLHCSYSFVW